jgi:hypothetical protein
MGGNNQEAALRLQLCNIFFFFEGLWLFQLSAELNHVRSGAKTLLNYVLTLIRRPKHF